MDDDRKESAVDAVASTTVSGKRESRNCSLPHSRAIEEEASSLPRDGWTSIARYSSTMTSPVSKCQLAFMNSNMLR
jgi:hypothetical protein